MTCSVVVSAFWTKISRCCVKKNYNDASDDVPDVKIPKHFPPREGPFLMFWKIGRLLQASLLYRARNWHWQLTRGSLIRLVGTNLQGFTTRGEITKNWFQKVIFTIGLPVNGIHCIQWCYAIYFIKKIRPRNGEHVAKTVICRALADIWIFSASSFKGHTLFHMNLQTLEQWYIKNTVYVNTWATRRA